MHQKRLVSVPNTGSGNNVLATTPTLVAPILGAASATSVNKVAVTAPATGATLTIADGKTLTVNSSVTLAGTDGTTMTFPTTSATLARTDASNTFTGHQTIEGVTSTGATGTGKLVFDASPTITGHPTIEGVTSTGATGTGKLVFDAAPTITGHPTIEGVTSTGATGLGRFVFDASPALTGSPTAPTATTGDNTTKIATTAFVTTAVANVENNNHFGRHLRMSTILVKKNDTAGHVPDAGDLTNSAGGAELAVNTADGKTVCEE